MRNIPIDISKKLLNTVQTKTNKSNPSTTLWIGRPTSVLANDTFLERQTVLNTQISDTSITVCHPRLGVGNTKIDIAYISNGIARVATAFSKIKMSDHLWIDSGFSESASAVAIAYDGTMPKNINGNVEFVTESQPWVFWVNSGALYGRKLGSTKRVTLAEQNCTDVAAVRAMWSEVGAFDFGLVVFFILSGSIYYRQFINGEWKDAEKVVFGPSGVIWNEVAASRTWDYRVVLQVKTSTGEIYEIFAQYMGIGKQNTEHISLKTEVNSKIMKINYADTSTREHINIDNSVSSLMQWGLPVFAVSANNIADNGDYGKFIEVTLDHPCNVNSVSGNSSAFTLTDSNGTVFYSTAVSSSEDGMKLVVGFADFNNAYGNCSLVYKPGTITSPPVNPDKLMQEWRINFTPTNLVPVQVDPPAPLEVWNE